MNKCALLNPNLRFKGFSGEWEENIVSSIFKVTRGRVLSKDLLTNKNQNSYPVYSSQTSNKGLLGWFNTYLFENAITWTTDGMNAGDVNFRIGKFYCTNVCGVLLSDEYCNLAMSLIINKFCKKFVSTQLGNPKLMNNTMSAIKIIFPKIDECEKIAKFFTLLDKQIDNNKNKEIKLLRIKSYYLNNIFI